MFTGERRGALLRRKGIYTSHISKWRQQRNRGALTALSPQPRGPKPEPANPLADEVARLQQENTRLQARLATAEADTPDSDATRYTVGAWATSLSTDHSG